VQAGDLIMASGLNDGIGVGVSPEEISAEQFEQIVGQAWETSAVPGVKSVRVAVGLIRRDPTVNRLVEYSRKQNARLAAIENRLAVFEAKMRTQITGRNLFARRRRKSPEPSRSLVQLK